MKDLVISERATDDLTELWLYIAVDSSSAADRFVGELYRTCRTLCDHPDLGRVRDDLLPEIRCLPYRRYLIFYRDRPDSIEIVRILSGYRDVTAIF